MPKSQSQIAQEWDRIAQLRSGQIQTGTDLSYNLVLAPTVLSLIADADLSRVLDVGCGTGDLTHRLTAIADRVTGVDISEASIRIARQNWHGGKEPEFVIASVQDYAVRCSDPPFTAAVANMTLMTVLDLRSALASIARLLIKGGQFVLTITHPFFWPLYWGYANEPWFHYSSEIAIEAPFRISLDRSGGPTTTHIHRPLDRYVAELRTAGFGIDSILEPFPAAEIQNRFPAEWQFPRFLAARCFAGSETG